MQILIFDPTSGRPIGGGWLPPQPSNTLFCIPPGCPRDRTLCDRSSFEFERVRYNPLVPTASRGGYIRAFSGNVLHHCRPACTSDASVARSRGTALRARVLSALVVCTTPPGPPCFRGPLCLDVGAMVGLIPSWRVATQLSTVHWVCRERIRSLDQTRRFGRLAVGQPHRCVAPCCCSLTTRSRHTRQHRCSGSTRGGSVM